MTFEVGPRWSVARWDVRSGSLLERTPLNLTGSRCIPPSPPDGRLLAIANEEATITLCNLATGQRETISDPAFRTLYSLKFSPGAITSSSTPLPGIDSGILRDIAWFPFPWGPVHQVGLHANGRSPPCISARARSDGGSRRRAGRKLSLMPGTIDRLFSGSLVGWSSAGDSPTTSVAAISLWSADTLELRREMPGHRVAHRTAGVFPGREDARLRRWGRDGQTVGRRDGRGAAHARWISRAGLGCCVSRPMARPWPRSVGLAPINGRDHPLAARPRMTWCRQSESDRTRWPDPDPHVHVDRRPRLALPLSSGNRV